MSNGGTTRREGTAGAEAKTGGSSRSGAENVIARRPGRVATGICCDREDPIDTLRLLASAVSCVRVRRITPSTSTCARTHISERRESTAPAGTSLYNRREHDRRACMHVRRQYAYRTHVLFRKTHICTVETRASANFAEKSMVLV